MVFELYVSFRAAWTVAGLILFAGAWLDGEIMSPADEREQYEAELRRAGDEAERKHLADAVGKEENDFDSVKLREYYNVIQLFEKMALIRALPYSAEMLKELREAEQRYRSALAEFNQKYG